MLNPIHPFLENSALTAFLIAYYGSINSINFALYGWDKAAARGQRSRVSEKTLLYWTFAGGALGALCAQAFFRHKTQKAFFKWFNWFCLGLHAAFIFLIMRSAN